MLGLEYFSFSELWSPVQLSIAVAIVVLYLVLTGPKRHLFAGSEAVSIRKKVSFVTGVIVYYLTQGGPLELLGHLMFSAHMTVMILAYLIAPPLILLGVPAWMARRVLEMRIIGRAIAFITKPLLSVLVFNILFSFYHMPDIHDQIMTNYTLHTVYYFALLIAAFMMWWPIFTPIKEINGLSELKKIGYIFANGVLITPACALIIFADHALFATYSDPNVWAVAMGYCIPAGSAAILDNFSGPEFFAIFSPQEDQQLGGVIMKVAQELIYGSTLAYVFFNWYIHERKQDEIEPDPVV